MVQVHPGQEGPQAKTLSKALLFKTDQPDYFAFASCLLEEAQNIENNFKLHPVIA